MKISQAKLEQELSRLIEKLNSKVNELTKLSRSFSLVRFVVFVATTSIFLGLYINEYKITATIVGAILSILFIVLMIQHNKIEKSIKKFNQYIQIKKENLARLKIDWENIPFEKKMLEITPTELEHDFNIVERNGLIHLISTGVSLESINFLREWLGKSGNDKIHMLKRQKIIYELKKKTHFRDRLLLTSRLSLNKDKLKVEILDWLKNLSAKRGLKIFTLGLSILSLANIALFIGYLAGVFDSYYYQLLMFYFLVYQAGSKYVRDVKNVSEVLFEVVRKFYSVFIYIERYNFGKSESTKELLSSFFNKANLPSKILGKVNFTIELINLRKNPFVWIALICVFPIDYLLAIKVENFGKSLKSIFPIWLETFQELEAYNSLATFAYLNPEYEFASIIEGKEFINAKSLGHPLIPGKSKIANDFELSERNKTNIITGSNMSGKSTFLKTIGINILLGYSGSVVCAKELSLAKINLYSCIRVSDSVVDGISYFYAEVKRLKLIIEKIKHDDDESLVLVDEIYKGTNNIERLVGSKALIKYLAENGICCVISTHDLEMVNITAEISSAANYHFKEIFEENKMSFNYKLTDGPCPTTNALKIMNLEGLPT